MRYLLDTNIVSNIVRRPRGPAGKRLRQVGRDAVILSIVVVGEARTWIAKGASARFAEQLEWVVAQLPVAPLEAPGDVVYANLRAELERSGQTIGANDTWIAAHALTLSCTLVTDNEREFRRVSGLRIENWLA